MRARTAEPVEQPLAHVVAPHVSSLCVLYTHCSLARRAVEAQAALFSTPHLQQASKTRQATSSKQGSSNKQGSNGTWRIYNRELVLATATHTVTRTTTTSALVDSVSRQQTDVATRKQTHEEPKTRRERARAQTMHAHSTASTRLRLLQTPRRIQSPQARSVLRSSSAQAS